MQQRTRMQFLTWVESGRLGPNKKPRTKYQLNPFSGFVGTVNKEWVRGTVYWFVYKNRVLRKKCTLFEDMKGHMHIHTPQGPRAYPIF